ncbi:oxidoreductase [Winslowiella iniecta]|uniref:Oxidoreductase n=1 Tax=Winslowiella iniecta TaxID=1560201 RepID=A0A0L7T457_9GAMM|nr:oxidoreductase [Winslowiella iniecta]KOC90172.1 oxidoreductase [Winslowiella iniecta]KOC94166.1 oxidoreductase [Winslowiella iniecta]
MTNAILLAMALAFSTLCLAHENSFRLINNGNEISITTADLEQMPSSEIRTSTNFTPLSVFTGVRFSELAENYAIGSGEIRVFAWDDYSYTMPVAELLQYNVILAYKKNGSYIDISALGPYVIIYPRDDYPELETLDVNAKTVWQIKTLEIIE